MSKPNRLKELELKTALEQAKKSGTVVVNFNVYNEEQLITWALNNRRRPLVYARLNPHMKSALEALVALKQTNKASFIEHLIVKAVTEASEALR